MDWNKAANEAKTLMQAHEALSRLMPRPNAPERAWAEYHRRSAAVYSRVAEIDAATSTRRCSGRPASARRRTPSSSQPVRESNAALSPAATESGIES